MNEYQLKILIKEIIKEIYNIKHISWDQGIINKSMGELGMFTFQNTSLKTLCGKRVNIKNIDNYHPTCSTCIETKKTLNNTSPPKGMDEKTYLMGKEYPPKKTDYSG